MRVVEAFDTYLRITENWCYNLIKNLENIELTVVSEYSENRNQFPLENARFRTAFQSRGRQTYPWLIQKVVNRVRVKAGWIWKKAILFRMEKPDIVHAHFSIVGWDYLWAARIRKIPLVVSFYGYDYERLPNIQPAWRKRYRKLFRHGSLFLAEGRAGRSKLIQMGCPEHKARVVHLGVDVEKITYYERPKAKFELKLVQIARFTDKKGHETTFQAFIKALSVCPNLTLTFVGRDADGIRPRLEKLSEEHGLTGRIRFIDSIDYSKLYDFLQDYHVFVHPSRYGKYRDSEGGAPVVLLDAQATGMPVLSTFHCDIPEEVVNGETGLLVEENGADNLALEIQRFYEMDQAEYRAYGRRAREHVEQHYQASKCSAELKQEYEMLLGQDQHLSSL